MSDKSYEVGRGRPPKSGQWKKGQSGNPSGKKKQAAQPAQPVIDLFAQQLLAPIQANQNGEVIQMPLANAMVTTLLRDFMTASFSQKLKAIMLFEKLGILDRHKYTIEAEAAEAKSEFEENIGEELRRMLEFLNLPGDGSDMRMDDPINKNAYEYGGRDGQPL